MRDSLAAFSLLVMIGGPVFAVIGVMALIGDGPTRMGHGIGSAIQFALVSIVAGGILRLLVSMDARLEARS
ncbi:MAG: hypothetical protein ACXW3K_05310 [Brevundimonas sp.]